MASVLLVTCVYGYAFIASYVAPPLTEKVIYEVWDVQHPSNDKTTLTVVYTRGQGWYPFYGEHPFEVGRSYHIKYVAYPDSNRYLTLVYMEEVHTP